MPRRITVLPLASSSLLPDTCSCGAPLVVTVVSVTVTVTEGMPVALRVNVALPALEASAAKVTFCAVAKLAGVKVSVPPPDTDRPVLPEVLVVVTVTLADGATASDTPTVPLALWLTDSELAVVLMDWVAAAVIVHVKVADPDAPVPSLAVTVTLKAPAVVGVPEISPEELMLSPAGRPVAVKVSVCPEAESLAAICRLTAVPTVVVCAPGLVTVTVFAVVPPAGVQVTVE